MDVKVEKLSQRLSQQYFSNSFNQETTTLLAPKANKILTSSSHVSPYSSQNTIIDLDKINDSSTVYSQQMQVIFNNSSDENESQVRIYNSIRDSRKHQQKIRMGKLESEQDISFGNFATQKHDLDKRNDRKRTFKEIETTGIQSDSSFENSLDFCNRAQIGKQKLPTRKKQKCSEREVNAAMIQTLENINATMPRSSAQSNYPCRGAINSHKFDEITYADQLFSEALLIELHKFSPMEKLRLKAKIIDFLAEQYSDKLP